MISTPHKYLKKLWSNNIFDDIPKELFIYIFSFIPEEYYYYSLILVNRYCNQMIRLHFKSKEEILEKYALYDDNNLYFVHEELSKKNRKLFDFIMFSYYRIGGYYTYRSSKLGYFVCIIDLLLLDGRSLELLPNCNIVEKESNERIVYGLIIKNNLSYMLMNIGTKLKENKERNDGKYFMDMAISFGSLDSLKVLHKNGCIWDEYSCSIATYYGHIDCLKYLHENGCPWDKKSCSNATKHGHLECLKYLYENGCSWDNWDEWMDKIK